MTWLDAYAQQSRGGGTGFLTNDADLTSGEHTTYASVHKHTNSSKMVDEGDFTHVDFHIPKRLIVSVHHLRFVKSSRKQCVAGTQRALVRTGTRAIRFEDVRDPSDGLSAPLKPVEGLIRMTKMISVGAFGGERFHNLQKAFENNFVDSGEVGASCAVVENGHLVASFWGGYKYDASSGTAEEQAEWTRDTLVNVWSTTKGVTAACVAMLVDRGLLSFDTPIAEIWPAFGTGAKKKVTLSMLMSHQAGLCGFREPIAVDDLFDLQQAANHLAEMEPFWTPGEGHGYHALTIGILVSELFRRVDGRTLKAFVSDELFGAHGLDIHIGLPVSLTARGSDVIAPHDLNSQAYATDFSDIQKAALLNPMMSPEVANTAGWKAAEIPSANGFASAEALALLYGALANDGLLAGKRLLGETALRDAITPQTPPAEDHVLKIETQWASGFLCNTLNLYGPNKSAFGHSGWGGSFAFADRNKRIGCAYTMNKMGTDLVGEPRAMSLVNALYQDLESK